MIAPAITTAVTTLTATGLLAGGCAYAALWPESQLFGKVLVAGRDPDEIALTYDDGPNDIATERLLEVLARHEVRATFFVIGNYVRQRPQIVRAIAAAGHLIGDHTMTHPALAWQSAIHIREELTDCKSLLEDTLGIPIRYFRPPFGARRPCVLRTARELGLTPVQWNVTAVDWSPRPPEQILAKVLSGIARNERRDRASNVLFHDGGHLSLGQPRLPTIEATDQLLRRYKGQPQKKFVTVDSWR
jgi:peptidoglycan/xylan/chitin deacetylase (PgdA/CDA1 family)